jgi:Skp family chaperone for outer membrane proteins
MALSKEQLAEWAQREAAYYAEAEKWKHLEEKMKREQEKKVAEWQRKDAELEKIIARNKAQEEIKKYSQEEINEAVHQIRTDRLKIILNPYV